MAWCKLHSQIAEYNKLGIRVRYMFYPRTGTAHRVLGQGRGRVVLQGSQRHVHRAKLGGRMTKAASCTSTPVAREYELGRELGISGTPGMVWSQAN